MRPILILVFLLFAAGASASDIVPALRLSWQPASQSLTFRFSAGCMSSSTPILGNDLAVELEGRDLRVAGGFNVGILPTITLQDFGQCPSATIQLPAIAPGTYRLRYRGRPLRHLSLGSDPLEIVLTLRPWLTLGDLFDKRRYGFNRIWDRPAPPMSPLYLRQAGPARPRSEPGSIMTHLTPDPLLYWAPGQRQVTFRFRFGCISESYLFIGAAPSVEFNPIRRTFTVSGDIRFLPLGSAKYGCHGNPLQNLTFPDLDTGEFQVVQDNKILYSGVFGPLHFNIDRFGMRLLE